MSTEYRALLLELVEAWESYSYADAGDVTDRMNEAVKEARTALDQPEPVGWPPRMGHILRLAEIIREVDGNHDKGAAALAEAILDHPGSRWQSREAQSEPVGVTDEEIMELMPRQMHEDLAAAARALAVQAGTDSCSATGVMRIMLNRHAVDHARAVLQRWGNLGIERCHRLQQENHRFREPERTVLCDILANGTLLPDPDGTRYGRPAVALPEPVNLFAQIDALLDGIDRDECHPDGGWWETSDGVKFGRIKLRELKELIAASIPLAQPGPVGLTDEELDSLFHEHCWVEDDLMDHDDFVKAARAVLARYGRTAITPIPVVERLPEAEDCDAEGRCWFGMWSEIDGERIPDWELTRLDAYTPKGRLRIAGWLPAIALPLPRQPAPDAPAP